MIPGTSGVLTGGGGSLLLVRQLQDEGSLTRTPRVCDIIGTRRKQCRMASGRQVLKRIEIAILVGRAGEDRKNRFSGRDLLRVG